MGSRTTSCRSASWRPTDVGARTPSSPSWTPSWDKHTFLQRANAENHLMDWAQKISESLDQHFICRRIGCSVVVDNHIPCPLYHTRTICHIPYAIHTIYYSKILVFLWASEDVPPREHPRAAWPLSLSPMPCAVQSYYDRSLRASKTIEIQGSYYSI